MCVRVHVCACACEFESVLCLYEHIQCISHQMDWKIRTLTFLISIFNFGTSRNEKRWHGIGSNDDDDGSVQQACMYFGPWYIYNEAVA